jgi:hypothetical protein
MVDIAKRNDMPNNNEKKCECSHNEHSIINNENNPITVKALCERLRLFNTQNYDSGFFTMIEEARKRLDIAEDTDGNDVISALYSYASILDEYYGHPALGVYEEIREWVVKFKGAGSDDDISILSELSDIYYELELYEDAIKTGELLYLSVCSKRGEEDNCALAIHENLAKIFFLNDCYKDSMLRLKRLANVYECQKRDPDIIAEIYYNIAVCCYKNNDASLAKENLQLAKKLCDSSEKELSELNEYILSFLSALSGNAGSVFLLTRWRNVWAIMR